MHEAKSQLSRLGKAAWQGEEVVIARAGEPYLRLVPYREGLTRRELGALEGADPHCPGLRRDAAGGHRRVLEIEDIRRRTGITVRLLLDTHVLLWSLTDPRKMSGRTREAVEDARNDVFVSAVSGWEIAVKRALGKLEAPGRSGSGHQAAGLHASAPDFPARGAGGSASAASRRSVRPDAGCPSAGGRTCDHHPGCPYPGIRDSYAERLMGP